MGSIIPSMVKAARIAVAIKEKMTLAMGAFLGGGGCEAYLIDGMGADGVH